MERRLLGIDPLTGIEEWFHHDDKTNTTYIEQKWDAQDTVDSAERLRNNSFGFSPKQELRLIVDIPVGIVYKWLQEGFDVFKCSRKELEHKLKDYPKLKTAPKRTSSNIIISGDR